MSGGRPYQSKGGIPEWVKAGHQHAMHKHRKNKQARIGKKLGSDENPGVKVGVVRQVYVRGQKERDTEVDEVTAWSMNPEDVFQAAHEMSRTRMKYGWRKLAQDGRERWQADLIQRQDNSNSLQGQANRAMMGSRPGGQMQRNDIPQGYTPTGKKLAN